MKLKRNRYYMLGGEAEQTAGVQQYTPEAAAEKRTVPVEVEDREIGVAKDKQSRWVIVFDTGSDAPDHREGGVDMELPAGTQIFNEEYYDEVKVAVQNGEDATIDALVEERDANLEAQGKPTNGMTEEQMQEELAQEDAMVGQQEMPQEMPQEGADTVRMRYGGKLLYRSGGITGVEDPIYDKRGKRVDRAVLSQYGIKADTDEPLNINPTRFEMANPFLAKEAALPQEEYNPNLPQRTMLGETFKQSRPLDVNDLPSQERKTMLDYANQYNPKAMPDQQNKVTIEDKKEYSTPSDQPIEPTTSNATPQKEKDYLGREFLTSTQNRYFNATDAKLGLQQLYNITRPSPEYLNPALVRPVFVNADVTPFTEQRAQLGRDKNNTLQTLKGLSQGSDLIAAAGMLNNQAAEGQGKVNSAMAQYLGGINQQNSQIANNTNQLNTQELNKFTLLNKEIQREDTVRRHKAIEDVTTEGIKNHAMRVQTGMQNKAQESNVGIQMAAIKMKNIEEDQQAMKAAIAANNFEAVAKLDDEARTMVDEYKQQQQALQETMYSETATPEQRQAAKQQSDALLEGMAKRATAKYLLEGKKMREAVNANYSEAERYAKTREEDKVYPYGRLLYR